MKKALLLSALLFTLIVFAQVPQGISYQAIAMNSSGNPIVSSNVGIRLSVLDNSASGTLLYGETHTKTTNAQGLFNLVISQGSVTAGTFASINWGTNSKFLKVEMDAAGGSNYVLVGTTQLLSVPYALAADKLITSAGEGITLVSPNGTPYTISVNDAGQLSLPTGSASSASPSTFYLYGTFNSFNPTTALAMANDNSFYNARLGYKYLTAGTELKFLGSNTAGGTVYGVDGADNLVLNGSSYTINSNGFYIVKLLNSNLGENYPVADYDVSVASIAPTIGASGFSSDFTPTYSVANNKFTYIINGVTSGSGGIFQFHFPNGGGSDYYGDNLADGTIDEGGSAIAFPGLTSTPKNFRVELILNFNGSGTYTITQI